MARGGARKGAGRPKGLEPTKAIRVPISTLPSIDRLITKTYKLPLYNSKVAAGLPSPADDDISENVDLNEYLIKHPTATFLVRATGDSMINAGIHHNDMLVVDRSLKPTLGKIIIVAIDGQLTVKRLEKKTDGSFFLMPDNPAYEPIEICEASDTFIWGVVTQVIHAV